MRFSPLVRMRRSGSGMSAVKQEAAEARLVDADRPASSPALHGFGETLGRQHDLGAGAVAQGDGEGELAVRRGALLGRLDQLRPYRRRGARDRRSPAGASPF